MKHVLFLDDEQSVLDSLRRTLRSERGQWDMTFVDRPSRALEILASHPFDAVISDLRMPEMNGLELLAQLQRQEHTKDIPVVILTGEADRALKREALDRGAADLLNKPVDRDDLIARVRSVLRLKAYQDELRSTNERLEEMVRERTQQLVASRREIIWRLAKAAEYRDEETGHHVIRVACYSRAIARGLGADKEFVDTLFLAAPLHDVGKIAIPDAILRKPGRLESEEWQTMQTHAELGAEILGEGMCVRSLLEELGFERSGDVPQDTQNAILNMARTIAMTHHEKWDGGGYPQGLRGEEIPLESRIVAIADVYDALRSPRPYKKAFSEDEALNILAEGAGAHFDPSVYAAFIEVLADIREIEAAYGYDQELAEALT